MIVRFFKTGQSNGEAPVNYLLSMRDHAGELRAEQAEILEGSPRLTIDLINGISRQHKYASGCLAFRANEQPSKAELFKIIDNFKTVVAPGLDSDQFNSLFVLHREPPDPKTGLSGFHVHFVMPMTLLSGTASNGKNMAGRRWNPHPPGKKTIETMALFTEITNHEHGWSKVAEKPFRVGVDSFWRKAGNKSHSQKAELLRQELSKVIRNGQVSSRAELCNYLDQSLGLVITRVGTDYLSVKLPGAIKAIRLKGPMFESKTDYATMRATSSQKPGTEKFSVPQYQQANARLSELLHERSNYLAGNTKVKKPTTTTNMKVSNYGKSKAGFRGVHDSHQANERVNPVSIRASGMERNLFPPSSGQWRNGSNSDGQSHHAGSQENSNPNQHAGHASDRPTGSGGQRIGRSAAPVYGSTIDAQIWELAIQLNDCDTSQMAGIMARINFLTGERSRQEGSHRKYKP